MNHINKNIYPFLIVVNFNTGFFLKQQHIFEKQVLNGFQLQVTAFLYFSLENKKPRRS